MGVVRPVALVLLLILCALILVCSMWRMEPASNTTQKTFDAILVLGAPSLRDGSPSPEQRERVLEGVREWRRGVAPRLVMSGAAAHNRWVEADSMAALALQQGVPAENVIREREARDTIQNVYYTAALMQARGWRSVEVVSSWSHLPRAARILSQFSLSWKTDAAPWPTEYTVWRKLYFDAREASYCMILRLFGFPHSPFLAHG